MYFLKHMQDSDFQPHESYTIDFNKMVKRTTITKEKFFSCLLSHVWDYIDLKQIRETGIEHSKIFIKKNFDGGYVGIGFGTFDFKNYQCFQFGDWDTFNKKFADQFSNDLS